ncbi:hypothetical protein CEXT_584561 [Caerostris extrusa]|uniref:Uncharacterized protein n=1 Tax=Caerostris extrusa TaxID=172846 RepID=A0AAV4U7C6_CAEEX|nr:hypothetical protein CEXT_584561 [Caerostris extrusa]
MDSQLLVKELPERWLKRYTPPPFNPADSFDKVLKKITNVRRVSAEEMAESVALLRRRGKKNGLPTSC